MSAAPSVEAVEDPKPDEPLEVVGHRIGGYSGARAVTAALVVLRFCCDILRRVRSGQRA